MIEPGETLPGFDFGNHLHIFVSRETGEGLIALVNLTTQAARPVAAEADASSSNRPIILGCIDHLACPTATRS